MAFLKRLSMCAIQCSAPIAAGLLLLISEVCKVRQPLLSMLINSEQLAAEAQGGDGEASGGGDDDNAENDSNEGDEDEGANWHMLGNFDASKREPAYAVSRRPGRWWGGVESFYYLKILII